MKRFLVLILILLLIVSMGACGNKEGEKDTDSTPEKTEPAAKATVEKGDWTSATIGSMAFEVRENWLKEKRDAVDIEYYYFDDTKLNYLLVSIQSNDRLGFKNTKEDLEMFLGAPFVDEEGLVFNEADIAVVGKDLGGYKFIYDDHRSNHENKITSTEFYTIYDNAIYWFYVSVEDSYLDDYMEDVDYIFSTLQTASGEANPIIE